MIVATLIHHGSVNAADSSKAPTPDTVASETNPSSDSSPTEKEQPDQAPESDDNQDIATALPVSSDPVQIYGWREWVTVTDGKHPLKLRAKLDTGARTSSIHASEIKMFERDGRKWVRFVVFDPQKKDSNTKDSKRIRIEAPLVRLARIKNPGGESEVREVVNLTFQIGDRTMTSQFTLNNRHNMLNPVLIGRSCLGELGWVDPSRTFLAEKNLMR